MKLLELKKKDADSIFKILWTTLSKEKLTDKLLSISTDGESTVASKKNGVTGKFLNKRDYIIHTHCIAHRLALGLKDMTEKFPIII